MYADYGKTVTGNENKSFPKLKQNQQAELAFKGKQDASKYMQVEEVMAGAEKTGSKRVMRKCLAIMDQNVMQVEKRFQF